MRVVLMFECLANALRVPCECLRLLKARPAQKRECDTGTVSVKYLFA